ncbi:diguanylate cyclase [uncultured Xylophilus sp.]|uniref:sensor domain-containing diguanylate cyclase n=1 Tax=uncultured Xylophilus sp. TaxID=296832 RepID=UPI0025E6500F|nr:diguanylate cyclase [uncultured Xylophilus sp.]
MDSEQDRPAALDALNTQILASDEILDDMVWLACQICETPISLVTLLDTDLQYFVAQIGVDQGSTARSEAFCHYTVQQTEILEVPDATVDPRFQNFSTVSGEPHIRFYAGAPIHDADGYPIGTLCVLDTKVRALDARQREALTRLSRRTSSYLEARRQSTVARGRANALKELLELLPDGIVTCDADGRLGEFNAKAREWHGVDPRALSSDDWPKHFGLYEASGEQLLQSHEVPLARAWSGERVLGQVIVIRTPNMEPRTVSCNAIPLRGIGQAILGAACTMHDVTEQIRLNRILEKMALTDELTGLPNRAAWMSELDRALARARRHHKPLTVGFLDLDGFKAINDNYGHAAGDEVLRQVSQRLRQALRANDYVARLAGDEFVMCLEDAGENTGWLEKIAINISAKVNMPLEVGQTTITPACSIGFATCTRFQTTATQLMQSADAAMYRAKRNRQQHFAMVVDA